MSAAEDKGGVDEGDGLETGGLVTREDGRHSGGKMAKNPEYAIDTSPRVGKQMEWMGRMGSVCRRHEGGM